MVDRTMESKPIPLTAERRAELRATGMLAVPGALSATEVFRLSAALDRIYDEERAQGDLGAGERMHLLGGIGRDDEFLELVDHPSVFPVVWGELGWNIHLYHCHLDVTPPRPFQRKRPVWRWHQDGGRQNLELDGQPRPRMSLKVAFWLSDVSEPGRGNLLVIPGSHTRDRLARRRTSNGEFAEPDGAMSVLAGPGDALVFDRRLWHSRSENTSDLTRRAIFLAYTYRWVRPRDDLGIGPGDRRFAALSPVRRQLLGEEAGPYSHWGLVDTLSPLRRELDRGGLLDPAVPSHR